MKWLAQQNRRRVFTTAITRRKNPILTSFISQVTPSESSVIRRVAMEPVYLDHLKSVLAIKGVKRVAMLHRIGRLEIGESSVLIAVSAAHRGDAFEACRYAIDTLKRTVPVWKKEHFEDGEVWVGLQGG